VQSSFPFVAGQVALVEKAQKEGLVDPHLDPRMITAGGLAMVLGMLVFEQYILQGTGLEENTPQETLQQIVATQVNLLTK
jgi:hypothetical protein